MHKDIRCVVPDAARVQLEALKARLLTLLKAETSNSTCFYSESNGREAEAVPALGGMVLGVGILIPPTPKMSTNQASIDGFSGPFPCIHVSVVPLFLMH